MSEQERQVPVWHEIVGAGYDPVEPGEMTCPDEDELRACGWVRAWNHGFRQHCNSLPRRRRKRMEVRIELSTRRNGCAYGYIKTVKPGECFMVSNDGELIPVDKPTTQSAE